MIDIIDAAYHILKQSGPTKVRLWVQPVHGADKLKTYTLTEPPAKTRTRWVPVGFVEIHAEPPDLEQIESLAEQIRLSISLELSP